MQIVVSRYNGDKRVATQPYELVTVANGQRKAIRIVSRRQEAWGATSAQRRFTGQWHHLHHWSFFVTGWAHAGQGNVATAVDCDAAPDRADLEPRVGRVGDVDRPPARDVLRGAPGSRRWQCGQYSGPLSKFFRHNGQLIVGID